VAPDPGSTWPTWLRIRVQLGLCGSKSGFNLAYMALDPGSTLLCGSGSGFNLAYVAPDLGSTWPMLDPDSGIQKDSHKKLATS